MARDMNDMPVGETVESVSVQPLTGAIRAAYDAPFAEPAYKAAALGRVITDLLARQYAGG